MFTINEGVSAVLGSFSLFVMIIVSSSTKNKNLKLWSSCIGVFQLYGVSKFDGCSSKNGPRMWMKGSQAWGGPRYSIGAPSVEDSHYTWGPKAWRGCKIWQFFTLLPEMPNQEVIRLLGQISKTTTWQTFSIVCRFAPRSFMVKKVSFDFFCQW